MSYSYRPYPNNNASIRSKSYSDGSTRTETARRDSGITAQAYTSRGGRTGLLIDGITEANGTRIAVSLTGRAARTVFRVLQKHYVNTGKSTF